MNNTTLRLSLAELQQLVQLVQPCVDIDVVSMPIENGTREIVIERIRADDPHHPLQDDEDTAQLPFGDSVDIYLSIVQR